MSMTKQRVEWRKPRTVRSEVSIRRQWRSTCGRLLVERVTFLLRGLAPLWRVIDARVGVVACNRTKKAAFRAAEKHAALAAN